MSHLYSRLLRLVTAVFHGRRTDRIRPCSELPVKHPAKNNVVIAKALTCLVDHLAPGMADRHQGIELLGGVTYKHGRAEQVAKEKPDGECD